MDIMTESAMHRDLAAASGGRVTLAKVNVDENPGLASRYDIRSIPTVLFFRGGGVVDRITGLMPKAVLGFRFRRDSLVQHTPRRPLRSWPGVTTTIMMIGACDSRRMRDHTSD